MDGIPHVFCVVFLLCCCGIPLLEALQCKQCPSFNDFLNGTLQGPSTNCSGSNATAVCNADTHFCMKIIGSIGGFPAGNKPIDVLQYGCASPDLLSSFTPNVYGTIGHAGNCQQKSDVRLPSNPAYANTNLTFSGTYCFCHTGLCNNIAGKTSYNVLMVAIAFVLGYFMHYAMETVYTEIFS
ncbi:uncharacterized protein LOC129595896 [Paramacrobiotus metropolitanus]|uniref:uncharacterized protein LOC129595896 n=1 Tax=Paramacrobiotus metropolitanus TaxID=2943436 RepID=UPI002445ED4D|nr:uncharacterized protein LOC129595896 [Paramacrobiotus metropolitanus]